MLRRRRSVCSRRSRRRGSELAGLPESEVASRREPDGSITFVTVAPGIEGLEFIPGAAGEKKTLITRDAQHEYVFTAR